MKPEEIALSSKVHTFAVTARTYDGPVTVNLLLMLPDLSPVLSGRRASAQP